MIPSSKSELEEARKLGYEYVETMSKNPVLKSYFESKNFLEEIDNMPKEYESPTGVCLLAYVRNQAAGIVSLKKLTGNICEMKRLFVRSGFQGIGLGRLLAEKVISEAKKLDYSIIRLDSSCSAMSKAILLYRSLGFYAIEPYNDNFIGDAIFMEKIL